jgi:ABC-2 type transport system permease protein
MNGALLVARRELFAYLRSPLGAIVIAGGLMLDSILFYFQGLTQKLVSAEVLREFFWNASAAQMGVGILISMRLVAEERQTGTMTLLNTSPLTDRQIVLGKFLSAFGVITAMTLLTFYMPLWVLIRGKVSWGHVAVGYLGMLLLGGASVAIGLFASALARSQVVAVLLGAVIMAPLLTLWMLARAADPPLKEFVAALALHHENYRPFMTGILDLGCVAYYVAITYFFLLAATKTLEARRWR